MNQGTIWRMVCMLIMVLGGGAQAADFSIHDGDTVVFLGDSITAARVYSRIIEDYTLLRFPDRKVRFINAGKGGETAKGSLARLDEAVFARGATVLTVAYGINDIGWGMKADAAHKQEYLDAIAEIIARCEKHHVRVFICSAPVTAEDPDKSEHGFLQEMCDEGLALARAKGVGTIDVQRVMRQAQRKVKAANEREKDQQKWVRMHAQDGVHLNELGQMAMAYAILKGLGAPAEVSSATVDGTKGIVVASEGCKVSAVRTSDEGVTFVRADERLPLNLQPLWMLQGLYIPIGEGLNLYMLGVRELKEGRYEVWAGGRLLGKWTAGNLDRGINIASASADPWVPGGPWYAQGEAVKVLTDMRDEWEQTRRNMAQTLKEHPGLQKIEEDAEELERKIVDLQREVARPVPVRFEVKRVEENDTPRRLIHAVMSS